ncbi:MAG: hypothetical protein GAK40_01396 [Burkholderia plantarii]|nr:MAG: hypothetical protein GAK40_01396 [Burkholderia plantarii]
MTHRPVPGDVRRACAVRAFSLIELMIALAVAALIAGFAVPAYRHQVERGHRLAVVTALYRVAHETAARGDGEWRDALPDEPVGLGDVPEQGTPVYRLSLGRAAEAGGYVVSAAPLESGPMRADRCGTYRLYADGTRRNLPPGATGPGNVMPDCWRLH